MDRALEILNQYLLHNIEVENIHGTRGKLQGIQLTYDRSVNAIFPVGKVNLKPEEVKPVLYDTARLCEPVEKLPLAPAVWALSYLTGWVPQDGHALQIPNSKTLHLVVVHPLTGEKEDYLLTSGGSFSKVLEWTSVPRVQPLGQHEEATRFFRKLHVAIGLGRDEFILKT